jgi:glycosyltransferase involved in cell wall biosynthesis
MKIGLDAQRAFLNNTGLGNYCRSVIMSLVTHHPEHHYFLFTPKVQPSAFYESIKDLPNVTIIEPTHKSFIWYWRSYGITSIVNRLQLDVYHGLSNELPVNIKKTKAKIIVTIHDLIPFKEDAFRNIFEDFFYKKKMYHACRRAHLITAISQATAEDIKKILGTSPNKIKVVYPPLGIQIPEKLPDVRTKYNLPENFLLQVGRVEYRKNVQIILRALIQLKLKGVHYVVVGRKSPFYKALASYGHNHGLGGLVHYIDPVSNEELAGLYQASTAVVYPSLYEGFGLPIIEAIAFGKPVLATAGGCFAEAGGPGAYYCNTESVNDVAQGIQHILQANHTQTMQAGKAYIGRFTTQATADALMACYVK